MEATSYAPACMQPAFFGQSDNVSEDCLFLNVFSPSHIRDPSGLLPVMVFIHGGAYLVGSAMGIDASAVALKGHVIVVTIQYRLGMFGFLTLPEMGNGPLNFGLLDQQLALGWVQQNISAFNGDPQRVTIFGESAGGSSVGFHLIMKSSWNYYSNAVMESPGPWYFYDLEQAQTFGLALASLVGCNSVNSESQSLLECLQKVPAETIVEVTLGQAFMPTIDGVDIASQPAVLFDQGLFNLDANIIIGTNQYEGNLLAFLNTNVPPFEPFNSSQYAQAMALTFGALSYGGLNTSQIVQWYSEIAAQQGYWRAFSAAIGDYIIVCGSLASANSIAAAQTAAGVSSSVWSYNFRHTPEPWPLSFLNATHETELPFVFSNPRILLPPLSGNFTLDEQRLADRVVHYWTTFARHGDPNDNAATEYHWPEYTEDGTVLAIDTHMGRVDASLLMPETCDLWATYLFRDD